MGKPFEQELQKFDSTYRFAKDLEISNFRDIMNNTSYFPLISIGSGGSLTSALFASLLHQQTCKMAIFSTPLEILSLGELVSNSSVLLITAGGKNYDIISAFRMIAEKEPVSLNTMCATKSNALKDLAKNYQYSNTLEFDLPCGRDGFLATNSLLSFNLLLLRLYENSFGNNYKIPESMDSLIHPGLSRDVFLKEFRSEFTTSFLRKDTFVILYGRWGKPAAFDLESKFTEAALANAQISDYRNFAHGRHNWLAKKSNQTSIIALVTPEDKKLAEKTLNLIPEEIPVIRISTDKTSGQIAAVDLITKCMYAVNFVGQSRNIDPGRPSVSDFGVKIYHLHVPLKMTTKPPINLSSIEYAALLRKLKNLLDLKVDEKAIERYDEAYKIFRKSLETARFGSVVLDYDGTMCDLANRYEGLSQKIGSSLSNLLANGVIVGIATGRGKSVRFDLQRALPKSYWSNVLIGYYSGSDIGFLDDNTRPDRNASPDPKLFSLIEHMKNPELLGASKIEFRPKQISFAPINSLSLFTIMDSVRSIVETWGLHGIQILESGHSVDALAPEVSKLCLVREVEALVRERGLVAKCLCIGDRGKWPGNDFAFLSGPYSLSVDTVSSDPNSCWNLAPLGHRGIQATLDYLGSLEFVEKGLMRFNHNKLQVV
jgi:hypothetical protein